MAKNGKIYIGVDLGTTNTCVALAKYVAGDKMRYEALENNVGKNTTPSMVGFTDEEVIIGKVAKDQQALHPKQTLYGAKRLIGRKFNDPEVTKIFKNAPFKIVGDEYDNPLFEIERNGKTERYRPEQISSIVLGQVKEIVKMKTGKMPDKCIITVPAYFNDLQRAATKSAAEIADLPIIHIINEPTAAAVAFQHYNNFDKGTVLVYDFGGGTLDVSIVEVDGPKFTVKAVSGDTALGGEDIDAAIVERMLEKFQKKYPDAPKPNEKNLAILKLKAEETKIQLSTALESRMVIPNFAGKYDLAETLRRAEMELICDDIFSKLTDCIDTAIEEAHITPDDITHIILVGGSSHIPLVNSTVSEYFDNRIKPLAAVNPDEAIALGAAILCDKMENGLAFNDLTGKLRPPTHKEGGGEIEDDGYIEIVDVQSTSIGILNGKTGFRKYIERNKPLPQKQTFTFRTTRDNQKRADIVVLIGEDDEVDWDERTHVKIGKYTFSGLPPRPKGQVLINVTLSVDEKGILNVDATCTEAGSSNHIACTIDTTKIFDDKEKHDMILRQQEIFDNKVKIEKYRELLNDLQSAIAQFKSKHPDKTVEANSWETQYKAFSGNIPKPAQIDEKIKQLQTTIDALKGKI